MADNDIMTEDNAIEREDKDSSQGSDKPNPCGICRAAGIPVCKGHGGGAGGGGSDSNGAKKEEAGSQLGAVQLNSSTPKPKNDDLVNSLERCQLWSQVDDFIFKYKNPSSLLSMTINMEKNTLICQGHDHLTKEEKLARDMLFEAIGQELDSFRKENPTILTMNIEKSHSGNQITINIPDQKCFDAFIQRLVDKNLLNLSDENLLKKQPSPEKKSTQVMDDVQSPPEELASQRTATTPFSIEPKPGDR